MNRYFADYRWKNGVPQGVKALEAMNSAAECFKIVMDPYRKRISVEKYVKGQFATAVYDSALLDFRKLNPQEQTAWQRETLEETDERLISFIRNVEDRVILLEHQHFVNSICRECRLLSPHGLHLSTHRMFYQSLGDSFNGVILFDANEHQVMQKKYAVNEEGAFTDLLAEEWEIGEKMGPVPA